MPKQKITKEMVVEAAFTLAREGGMERVMVKNIAERLGCSVQPIYSYCRNIDELRKNVAERTKEFIRSYVAAHIEEGDFFRSTGRAYLQLAKEESNLYKIFILHQREGISSFEEFYSAEASSRIAGIIAESLNLSISQAKRLHTHMLIYTIGIGAIFSVTSPGIPADEIYSMQEKAYEAFLRQAEGEGEEENGK